MNNLNAIELRHLRYFVAVVENKGFRGAAQRLHVSQPPLTRQIQQLEEILGVTLLVRHARGIETTAAGAVLFDEARNLLLLTEQAVDRTRTAAQGQLGRLDVGTFGSAVLDVIPRILHDFRAIYPKVEVVLHTLDREGQLRALRERRITVAFNRFFGEDPAFRWEVVRKESLHVAVPTAHRLAKLKVMRLRDLANERLILYPRSPRPSFIDHALRLFHSRDLTPVTQEVDDVFAAVALVSGGMGVSLVVDSTCRLQMPGVSFRPLTKSDNLSFDLCMICRRDDESPLLRAFIDVVRGIPSASSKR